MENIMNVNIRSGDTSDWQIVKMLNVCVYEDNRCYDNHLDMSRPDSQVGKENYKQQLSDPGTICLIAEAEGKPVGYIVGGEKQVDYRSIRQVEIFHMGVASDMRSRGIGSKLVTRFKETCKKKGYDSVYVSVYHGNKRGINFYTRIGFSPIDLGLETDL